MRMMWRWVLIYVLLPAPGAPFEMKHYTCPWGDWSKWNQ